MRNMLTLRKEIHYSSDENRFAFVPKGTGDSLNYCVHFVRHTKDFGPLCHNRVIAGLRLDTILAPEFLYARFEWTIFSQMAKFAKRNQACSVGCLGPGMVHP
jgi:hypothetical protein